MEKQKWLCSWVKKFNVMISVFRGYGALLLSVVAIIVSCQSNEIARKSNEIASKSNEIANSALSLAVNKDEGEKLLVLKIAQEDKTVRLVPLYSQFTLTDAFIFLPQPISDLPLTIEPGGVIKEIDDILYCLTPGMVAMPENKVLFEGNESEDLYSFYIIISANYMARGSLMKDAAMYHLYVKKSYVNNEEKFQFDLVFTKRVDPELKKDEFWGLLE